MPLPTFTLEEQKLPRVILSVRPKSGDQDLPAILKKVYAMGVWFFDLPTKKHLESFRELKRVTEDDRLRGLCHVRVEEGVSCSGKPIHWLESKITSTVKRNIVPSELRREFFPSDFSGEVLTQKEIDRIAFDPIRFDQTLSLLRPDESPFVLVGEKYSDWLLGLGRFDLLKIMVSRVREKGFIPIFSGQWATFVLPIAKPLDTAAYAIPINKKWSHFDLNRACDLIKKFDRPVISLNPLANGELADGPEEAFSFLFKELKISGAITEISMEEEARTILKTLEAFPSLTPYRKT